MIRRCDCGRPLASEAERADGRCFVCTIASWSPQKRAAVDGLIDLAIRRSRNEVVDDTAIYDAVYEAFGHLGRDHRDDYYREGYDDDRDEYYPDDNT